MRRSLLCVLALSAGFVHAADAVDRLGKAAEKFKEVMDTPDKGIPRGLLDKGQCLIIVPNLKKGAFVFGGEYGKGFVSCRKDGGGWSAPGSIRIEGGSFGFQIGGEETDIFLLIMNKAGRDRLAFFDQVHSRRRRHGDSRSGRPYYGGPDRCGNDCRDPDLVPGARTLRRDFAEGRDDA